MSMIADILLAAGTLGAAFYCLVLSRRLNRFNDLETGVGGAVAVLSAQVDDMTRALQEAQSAAQGSSGSLEAMTGRAEGVARRLELLVASMHDLPPEPPEPPEPSRPSRPSGPAASAGSGEPDTATATAEAIASKTGAVEPDSGDTSAPTREPDGSPCGGASLQAASVEPAGFVWRHRPESHGAAW